MLSALNLKSLPGGVYTSLDVRTPADRRILYSAVMGDSKEASDVLNTDLSVVHVVFTQASAINPDTSKRDHWIRTILLLADGGQVAFGSQGILKSLGFYALCVAPPPWNPPARMRLKSEQIGRNRWYTLEAVEDADQPLPTGKRPKA
jgi:hypothetical protein